jgi:uncharacterized membrane-anchored protein YhcB (DUF1043 family)
MASEPTFLWLAAGILTGLLGIVGYFVRLLIDDVRELQEDAQECKVRTSELRAHVSENYAKKAEVQHSLDRIHTRLDGLPREILHLFRGEK